MIQGRAASRTARERAHGEKGIHRSHQLRRRVFGWRKKSPTTSSKLPGASRGDIRLLPGQSGDDCFGVREDAGTTQRRAQGNYCWNCWRSWNRWRSARSGKGDAGTAAPPLPMTNAGIHSNMSSERPSKHAAIFVLVSSRDPSSSIAHSRARTLKETTRRRPWREGVPCGSGF